MTQKIKIASFVFSILFVLFLHANNVYASPITHEFKNPSFSGKGTASHYLTVENQEFTRKAEIEDALEADRIFTILMGDKVAPRREFIETNSAELDMAFLDI